MSRKQQLEELRQRIAELRRSMAIDGHLLIQLEHAATRLTAEVIIEETPEDQQNSLVMALSPTR